uniref:Uncharacterized protein n=1 Tax=Globodera rostochiensis TaxID=31243 RepID=A0A914GRV3_GLORO
MFLCNYFALIFVFGVHLFNRVNGNKTNELANAVLRFATKANYSEGIKVLESVETISFRQNVQWAEQRMWKNSEAEMPLLRDGERLKAVKLQTCFWADLLNLLTVKGNRIKTLKFALKEIRLGMATVAAHCWPTMAQILFKLAYSLATHETER